MYSYVVILFCLFASGYSENNNVCRTYQDYYTIKDNPNCYYNFAADKSVPDIIKLSGFPFEEHKLVTPDGYILILHRIPNSNHANPKKSIMYLQHGLYSTSATFVALRNESLGFMLAEQGYDVWIMNVRGNVYSDKHNNMTVHDFAFWDFSLDEISTDDMSLTLNYISEKTNSKGNIIYVGHSLGTTSALIYSADRSVEAKKLVKFFILMGPTYILANMITPIGTLAYFGDMIINIIDQYEMTRLVSDGNVINSILKMICLESPRLLETCMQLLGMIYGVRHSILPEHVPILLNIVPLGSSIKMLRQIAGTVTKPFAKYDHGYQKNLMIYGEDTPAVYDIQKITVPVHIMAARNDWLTTYRDAKVLFSRLPAGIKTGLYSPPDENFSHMDFIIGSKAKTLANDYILNLISKYN